MNVHHAERGYLLKKIIKKSVWSFCWLKKAWWRSKSLSKAFSFCIWHSSTFFHKKKFQFQYYDKKEYGCANIERVFYCNMYKICVVNKFSMIFFYTFQHSVEVTLKLRADIKFYFLLWKTLKKRTFNWTIRRFFSSIKF